MAAPTKRLMYDGRPFNVRKLMDELLAAIPAARPIDVGGLRMAVTTVEGTDAWAAVTLPETIPDADVQAVINAHDGLPDVLPPAPNYGSDAADIDKQAATAVQQLRAFIAYDTTGQTAAQILTQMVPAVKLLCRVAIFFIKARAG
jgi:hypothetical protein